MDSSVTSISRAVPVARVRLAQQSPLLTRMQSPVMLMMVMLVTFQTGIALSKDAVDTISAPTVAFLRQAFGATMLFLIYRPDIRSLNRRHWITVASMGCAGAGMNVMYFLALSTIPIGFATTVTFGGPCILALSGTRDIRQLTWVIVATFGVALMAPWGERGSDSIGFLFAAIAALSYSAYIVLSKRAGQMLPTRNALPVAMAIGAVLLAPIGISSASHKMQDPTLLIVLALASMLSTVLPNMLEFLIIKRVPTSLYAVMITLDPAVASIAGFLLISESIGLMGCAAIACITVGSILASRTHNQSVSPAPA